MKKILSFVLAITMVLALTACGGATPAPSTAEPAAPASSAAPAPESKEPTGGNKTIAGIVFQEDQFFKMLSAGYSAAAKELGYDIQLANTTNDQSKETEIINTYAAQGIAGIAVSPMNTQVSPATLEAANKAGLKIAICNSAIDAFPYAIASYSADNKAFCRQTGDMAVEFIKEKYPADQTLKIAIVQFKTQVPEQSADRVAGFFAALDEAKVNYEIVADQDAWLQDMAVAKVGDMLAANPSIDIIYAANDGGTVGSVMAVENAGLAGKVNVFGTDASEQIVGLLKADTNILQAVTGQDPFAIGYNTVKALVDDIEGRTVEGAGKTNIIPGIPLKRGDTTALDTFLADQKSKM